MECSVVRTCSNAQLDIVDSGNFNIDGVIHPLIGSQPTHVVTVAVDHISARLHVHSIIAVCPPAVPFGVISGGDVVIRRLGVRIRRAYHPKIEIRSENDTRYGLWLLERTCFIGINLTEHRIHNVFFELTVSRLQILRELHQRSRRILSRWRWSTASPVIQQRLIVIRFGNAQNRRNIVNLLQRPPRPADAEVLQQTNCITEPNI